MTVKYNKTKVDNFKAKLADFSNNKKEPYINSLRKLNGIISTVIDNYRNASTDNQNTFYKDNNHHYILTPEKVLMKINQNMNGSLISDIPDSSLNSLIDINGNDCFYSNIEYKNTNTDNHNDKISNRYVQVGLGNDLSYNQNSYLTDEKIYKVNTESNPVFNNKTNCDEDFLYKCDGYSKMTGSNFYGIGDNGDVNNCECYVMDEKPSDSIGEKVLSIDVTEALLGSNDFKTNYLGIMMNGNAYALKNPNFSDNFSDVYVPDSDNHNNIFDTSISKTNCNMYTGSGVYGIKINSLGVDVCKPK
tara:strand:+ start:208 stop:1116 length:909 start_codon:yes stop_codon:yes gene_type:complete